MTTPHTGLILSPFDPRFRSGIDWESLQREANAKDQRSALMKKRGADKQFLEQPPHFRPPQVTKKKAAALASIERRVQAEKRKAERRVPVPWVKPEKLTADSTANGRRLDSKCGKMRRAMLERGPLNAVELAVAAGVETGRMARDLLGYDIKLGLVKKDTSAKPVRYFVPSNPPKDAS